MSVSYISIFDDLYRYYLSASIQFNNPTYLRYYILISHFLSLESYKRAEMSVLCKAYYFAFNQINLASLFEEI